MAVVEPVVPIRLPVRRTLGQRQQALARKHGSSTGRGANGDGSSDAAAGEPGQHPHADGLSAAAEAAANAAMAAADGELESKGELAAEQQEEVLRAAAHQVALLAAKLREEGMELHDMPDPSGSFEEARRWQRCEFRLELAVAPAAAAAASTAGEEPRGVSAAAARALGRRMALGGRRPSLRLGRGHDAADLVLNGTLSSHNCGTRLTVSLATAHMEEYYGKAVRHRGEQRAASPAPVPFPLAAGCFGGAACGWGGALLAATVPLQQALLQWHLPVQLRLRQNASPLGIAG